MAGILLGTLNKVNFMLGFGQSFNSFLCIISQSLSNTELSSKFFHRVFDTGEIFDINANKRGFLQTRVSPTLFYIAVNHVW